MKKGSEEKYAAALQHQWVLMYDILCPPYTSLAPGFYLQRHPHSLLLPLPFVEELAAINTTQQQQLSMQFASGNSTGGGGAQYLNISSKNCSPMRLSSTSMGPLWNSEKLHNFNIKGRKLVLWSLLPCHLTCLRGPSARAIMAARARLQRAIMSSRNCGLETSSCLEGQPTNDYGKKGQKKR